ncbi:hypothetical protein TNCV_2507491 [Trichonephila clavipes]|nr:hypothetical protein TNCV_2507491 [Trichonephila clavipes]
MRRNEGRVVNTPLVFKRVLFQGRGKGRKKEDEEKSGENGRRENGEETRGEDRRDGKRKGLSPEIGVKKTMNAGGVENGNMN